MNYMHRTCITRIMCLELPALLDTSAHPFNSSYRTSSKPRSFYIQRSLQAFNHKTGQGPWGLSNPCHCRLLSMWAATWGIKIGSRCHCAQYVKAQPKCLPICTQRLPWRNEAPDGACWSRHLSTLAVSRGFRQPAPSDVLSLIWRAWSWPAKFSATCSAVQGRYRPHSSWKALSTCAKPETTIRQAYGQTCCGQCWPVQERTVPAITMQKGHGDCPAHASLAYDLQSKELVQMYSANVHIRLHCTTHAVFASQSIEGQHCLRN